jgi:F-type H+-transporting ATPase subunit c
MQQLLKFLAVVVAVAVSVLAPIAPAFAQTKTTDDIRIEKLAETHGAFYGASFGAGLGAGLTIIGAGIGFARIGSAALESMARQPETAPRVQTAMIIIGALLEGATMLSLVVCILIAVVRVN